MLARCVLPPPTEEVELAENQAPTILVDTLSPAPSEGPKVLSTTCDRYPFYAQVQDPDLLDTIYWKVFRDYHRDDNRLGVENNELPPNPTNPEAPRLIKFYVEPDDLRFNTGRLTDPHVVELFISDRPILTNEQTPVARATEPGALKDLFTWTVSITDEVQACPRG